MRGGAQVKEALGFVTLLWNHPVLTGMLLLIFTPPFFPLVVYFSPLLMSTALCVVALVSVGSQMEKIKAEGGPGQQLETHLARDQGVSTWAPQNHSRNESLGRHYGGESRHRNLYASSGISVNVVPAPPSWTGGQDNPATTRASVQLRPTVENHPATPAAAESSDEDWWDTWVKEYESRPGWGDADDQAFRTPALSMTTTTTSQTPTIPASTRELTPSMAPLKPPKPEIRDEIRAPVAAPVAAPIPALPVAAPVSVSVVNRQEASRSISPPPTTSTSRTSEEVVVSVKVTDYQPHISTLAPIRTGREKRDHVRQVDRIGKTPQEILLQKAGVDVAERVSDVQALQSIEKLLHMEIGGSTMAPPPPPASVPRKNGVAIKGLEKNRNKSAGDDGDIAGETPLLRHLKTSRSEMQSRSSSAYSPLPLRSSRGLMSEKVLPPPQFSPSLLQSLQPLPPKGLSPRPLPNSSTAPLGNPVEKIPQWVYDGIPKEKAEKQAMKAETAEEKHVRAFEQAVKVLSYTRRRTHARRPAPNQVDSTANLQGLSTPSTPSVAELLPTGGISEDPHGNSAADSNEGAPVTTLPKNRAFSPRISRVSTSAASSHVSVVAASPPKASMVAASPPQASTVAVSQQASRASSPQSASMVAASPAVASSPQEASMVATSPRPASRASSPQSASIAASSRPVTAASSPQKASIVAASQASSPPKAPIAASLQGASGASSPQSASMVAASPRPVAVASSPQKASIAAASRASSPQTASQIAASPRPASSPPKAPIAASPHRASRASSPSIGPSPWPASIASSPQKPAAAPIAARASVASSPHQASVPSSPSMPQPRRRRHSSKHCTDKVALPSPSLHRRIEGSTYYDAPGEETLFEPESAAEDIYIPIEKEVGDVNKASVDSNCVSPRESNPGIEAQIHWGRSFSYRRSSNSRRRLEPRRVVTSQDTDMFCLKNSLSMRNGQTVKFVESSTTDDERESVTPRASRRSMGRTIKPLVWRSRSVQAHEDSD